MSQLERLGVNLYILSPIHVGTDQELDPFSYVIKNRSLLLIDFIKWMENFPNKEELHERMNSDNFVALRAFIAENFDDDSSVQNSIPVESTEVLATYHKAIYDKASQNQALINFMTRNEITRIPYIPGSSIKGAIRTAIANQFVKIAGVTSKNKKKIYKPKLEPDYNEKIFGHPTDDPMKNLKVSDVSLDKFGSAIYEAKEHSFKESSTPKGSYEAAVCLCQADKPVVHPLHFSLKPFNLKNITIDLQFIVDALYQFYTPKFKDEYSKFYSISGAKNIRQAIAPMNMEVARLKSNETLIRIGHFSHVECVTLDGVRQPKTRKGNDGKFLPWGITRTLANGIYPFGWAKLEFVNLKSEPRAKTDWPFSLQELEKNIQTKKEAIIKANEAIKVAAKQAMEAEKKRVAKEKRNAELEAMTPEERALEELDDSKITENRVIEIYNEIDGFSEENKKAAALALKKYWEACGKWSKPKGKKTKAVLKQMERVKEIKEILGEPL